MKTHEIIAIMAAIIYANKPELGILITVAEAKEIYQAAINGSNIIQPTPMTFADATKIVGKTGGNARAAKLSPERRREIAIKAAKARWITKD